MSLVDEADRDRIATAHHETLFVEAGAGSGKTASLVSRLVNLVVGARSDDPVVDVESIAAITFTEAAAAELRTRVRQALEDVVAGRDVLGVPGGPHAPARAAAALERLDGATICTLHAFAQRLLTSSPIEAGLPPRLSVHDDISSRLRFDDRWTRFERRLLEDPELDTAWEVVMAFGLGSEQLRAVAGQLAQNWDLVEAVPELVADARRRTVDPTSIPVADWSARLDALADAVASKPETCTLRRWFDEKVAPMRAVCASFADRPLDVVANLADPLPKPGNKGNRKDWDADEKQAFGDEYRAWCADVQRARSAVLDDALTRLGAELADYTVRDAEARAAEGVLEFHDLLVLARRLLRRDPTTRRRIHERYDRLLIDEFQDTDPLQIELSVRIAGDPDCDPATPWTDVPVGPGRLFFVGDPKQSIYRFRRADIDLFLRAQQRFATGATALSTNFRTVAPIVDVINALFGALIESCTDGIGRTAQPAYTPLDAHRPAAAPDAGPAVLALGDGTPHERAGDARTAEARDVAAALVRASTEGWQVDDGRPCRWADMCILLPSRTSLPFLRDALGAADVPYRIESGTLVYGTTEVNDLLAVLRAIDDPGDAIAIAGALRSPGYACGDDDLARWVRAHGPLRYLGASVGEVLGADDAPAATDPVSTGLRDLRRRHRAAPFQAVPTIVDDVVRERRLHALSLDGDGHRDAWRLLTVVREDARAFADTEPGGLRAFLRWASLRQDDKVRATSPVIPEADVDAVRIMTVHASKGLEFPITVVSGLSGRDPSTIRGATVQFRPEGGFDVRYRSGMETTGFEAVRTLEETMDFHERIRLLYVALTRARDHLVVSTHHVGSTPNSHGHRIVQHLSALVPPPASDSSPAEASTSDHDIEWFTTEEATVADVGAEPSAAEIVPLQPASDADRSRWDDDLAAWRARRASVLAAAASGASVSATRVARLLGDADAPTGEDPERGNGDDSDLHPPERPPWRRGRAGTNVGRAVHAVLQHVDFDDPDDVDALARWQARTEGIEDRVGVVATKARAALGSDLLARARAATRRWRELHVAVPVATILDTAGGGAVPGSADAAQLAFDLDGPNGNHEGTDGLVFEGFVDLLFEEEGRLVVVDFKTDAVTDANVDRALAGHAPQGAAYALALEAATGLEVAEVHFLYLPGERAVDAVVPDLDERRAEVLAALAGSVSA